MQGHTGRQTKCGGACGIDRDGQEETLHTLCACVNSVSRGDPTHFVCETLHTLCASPCLLAHDNHAHACIRNTHSPSHIHTRAHRHMHTIGRRTEWCDMGRVV